MITTTTSGVVNVVFTSAREIPKYHVTHHIRETNQFFITDDVSQTTRANQEPRTK